MDAGSGLLGYAPDVLQNPGIPAGLLFQAVFNGGKQISFFLAARVIEQAGVGFRFGTERHQQGGITTIIQNHVRCAAVLPFHDAVGIVPVVGQRFALKGKNRCSARRDCRRSVILSGEDIARRPAHLRAQCLERFYQHSGLDGHMQAAGDSGALQRLLCTVFLPHGHETRHFGFGDQDFLASPVGKRQVSNFKVRKFRLNRSVHGYPPCSLSAVALTD